ncbi:MAG TPA: hypothetical protein VFF33_13270, partial [Ignavibacteriaceae bacterium]|nr:hypothetical protein [Ignavibacteriaceae bacterium]
MDILQNTGNKILKENEGYVLPYILLITILLTTIILSVFTVIYYSNKIFYKEFNKIKLDAYCKSEISYLLKDSVIHQDTSFNYLKNNNQFYVDYRRKGFYLEVTIT